MQNNKDIHDELNEIAPFLAGLEKKNHFKVPENYFEEFPQKMRDRIGYAAPRSSFWVNLQRNFIPKLAPAFAVMSLFILAGIFFIWKNNTTIAVNAKPVSVNEYILEQVDEETIMDELASKTKSPAEVNSKAKKKNTEDYILDNVDENTISEEL